jgi:hypothetical protein
MISLSILCRERAMARERIWPQLFTPHLNPLPSRGEESSWMLILSPQGERKVPLGCLNEITGPNPDVS